MGWRQGLWRGEPRDAQGPGRVTSGSPGRDNNGSSIVPLPGQPPILTQLTSGWRLRRKPGPG